MTTPAGSTAGTPTNDTRQMGTAATPPTTISHGARSREPISAITPAAIRGSPKDRCCSQPSGPPSSPAAAWMNANAAPATTSSTAATRPAA